MVWKGAKGVKNLERKGFPEKEKRGRVADPRAGEKYYKVEL